MHTTTCPTWCVGSHDTAEITVHTAADRFAVRGLTVSLTSTDAGDYRGDPAVTVRADVNLSAGEARELAAALLDLADRVERLAR